MARAALPFVALLAAGCGRGAIAVNLTSDVRIRPVTIVDVTLALGGDEANARYRLDAPVEIGPDSPQSLVAVLPAGKGGSVGILVQAYNGAVHLASGTAAVDASAGKEVEVTVVLTPGNTGDPCTDPALCNGDSPICRFNYQGITWPGGYCAGKCNPARSDPNTGVNPDCPGKGWCDSEIGCVAACTAKSCRPGYACFGSGCLPVGYSTCNPTSRTSCGAGRTCIRLGDDDVGSCTGACNPFQQACGPINGQTAGCFASADTGDGGCLVAGTGGDGAPCRFLNGCRPGFGCNNRDNLCRPYCGGPSNRGCTNGRTCIDFTSRVKKMVVGLCAG